MATTAAGSDARKGSACAVLHRGGRQDGGGRRARVYGEQQAVPRRADGLPHARNGRPAGDGVSRSVRVDRFARCHRRCRLLAGCGFVVIVGGGGGAVVAVVVVVVFVVVACELLERHLHYERRNECLNDNVSFQLEKEKYESTIR